MRSPFYFVLLCLLQGVLMPSSSWADGRLENFKPEQQTLENWCWAAALTQEVNRIQVQSYRQCDIVNALVRPRLGPGTTVDCCSSPTPRVCDRQASRDEIAYLATWYGLVARIYEGPLRLSDVHEYIDEQKGVLIGLMNSWGDGHLVSMVGYDQKRVDDATIDSILIADPHRRYLHADSQLSAYSVPWSEVRSESWPADASWEYTIVLER